MRTPPFILGQLGFEGRSGLDHGVGMIDEFRPVWALPETPFVGQSPNGNKVAHASDYKPVLHAVASLCRLWSQRIVNTGRELSPVRRPIQSLVV